MNKRYLRNALMPAIALFRKFNAGVGVAALASHGNPKLNAIGNAIHELLTNEFSTEEKNLFALIERRRSDLLCSHETVAYVDYGAGRSGSNRSQREMELGVESKALLSDICKASKSVFWVMLLFKLVRKLEPLSLLELGSCVGISASYQAAALKLNRGGKITTLEGSPDIAAIAQETFRTLNLDAFAGVIVGPFQQTLKKALQSSQPIDFFFNDGHHDHDAVMRYFNESLPYLSKEAVIVFDDISWSPGMKRAWIEIKGDKRVFASIDLSTMGIALIGNNGLSKEKFRIPLLSSMIKKF